MNLDTHNQTQLEFNHLLISFVLIFFLNIPFRLVVTEA